MNLPFERSLTFERSGVQSLGVIQIHRLEQLSAVKWACHWSLSYVHPEESVIYGEDALDAVVKTLNFLAELIRDTAEDGLKIWWHYDGDNGGMFPASEGE